MSEIFLCWQNDRTVLGVADSEEKAKEICSEYGDSYMSIELNKACRENVECTPICIYNISGRFLTYEQAIEEGIEFTKEE